MLRLKKNGDGIVFSIQVQTRSSKNEICGIHGDLIKVKLTSPPIDGAANEGLIKFLSDKLDVSKWQIEIVRGHKSKNKLIKISGVKKERVDNLFKALHKP